MWESKQEGPCHVLRNPKHYISSGGPAWNKNHQTFERERKIAIILPQLHKNGEEWEQEALRACIWDHCSSSGLALPWGELGLPGQGAHQPSISCDLAFVDYRNPGRRSHFLLDLEKEARAFPAVEGDSCETVSEVWDGAVLDESTVMKALNSFKCTWLPTEPRISSLFHFLGNKGLGGRGKLLKLLLSAAQQGSAGGQRMPLFVGTFSLKQLSTTWGKSSK